MNTTEPRQPGAMRPIIGLLLARLIVPAWILAGAIFKLMEHTPRLLPEKTVLAVGKSIVNDPVQLYYYLGGLILLEFLAAGVMVLYHRLARIMGILVLSCFCLILIIEMIRGNWSSCGCLGADSPPPWMMLLADGALLAGLILCKPRKSVSGHIPMLVWTAVAITATTAVILPETKPPPPRPAVKKQDDKPAMNVPTSDDGNENSTNQTENPAEPTDPADPTDPGDVENEADSAKRNES